MVSAMAFAISVCDWRGRKPATAWLKEPLVSNNRSISASCAPEGGEEEAFSVKAETIQVKLCAGKAMASGGNVGHQLHFQQSDVVLELQFAFFQAAQLQFVVPYVAHQQLDDGIQIAMLDFQLNNASLDIFDGRHGFGEVNL
jgi:hypothetical protein